MRVIYVDDEQASIQKFQAVFKDSDFFQTLDTFTNPRDAAAFAEENKIDLAFLDMEMPVMNGIELAKRLCKINPNTKIVFLTAYDNYALSAYGVDAIGYLLKPYRLEDVVKEIEKAKRVIDIPQNVVYVQTMPRFDVFVDGIRLYFKSEKAKELLALMIDKRGATVNNDYAITYLWENKSFDENTKALYRMTKKNLKDFLDEAGIGFIVNDTGRNMSVNMNSFTCDYYELTHGNKNTAKFNGEYMFEYSWAEKTALEIEKIINV